MHTTGTTRRVNSAQIATDDGDKKLHFRDQITTLQVVWDDFISLPLQYDQFLERVMSIGKEASVLHLAQTISLANDIHQYKDRLTPFSTVMQNKIARSKSCPDCYDGIHGISLLAIRNRLDDRDELNAWINNFEKSIRHR